MLGKDYQEREICGRRDLPQRLLSRKLGID
jgi:hypothetical protein